MFFIIPCIDMYEKIDMRTQTYNVPPQEVFLMMMMMMIVVVVVMILIMIIMMVVMSKVVIIKMFLQILTKDSVTVFVNAIMYYKVKSNTAPTISLIILWWSILMSTGI